DHRLISEGLYQLDLFLGEWTYGSPVQNEHANWRPITQKRHAQNRAKVAECCQFTGIFRVSKHIRDLNGFALQQNSGHHATASRRKYQILYVFSIPWALMVARCRIVARVIPASSEDYTLISLAKTSRRRDQRVEHLRQIES